MLGECQFRFPFFVQRPFVFRCSFSSSLSVVPVLCIPFHRLPRFRLGFIRRFSPISSPFFLSSLLLLFYSLFTPLPNPSYPFSSFYEVIITLYGALLHASRCKDTSFFRHARTFRYVTCAARTFCPQFVICSVCRILCFKPNK